jgi:hypothetical protein
MAVSLQQQKTTTATTFLFCDRKRRRWCLSV